MRNPEKPHGTSPPKGSAETGWIIGIAACGAMAVAAFFLFFKVTPPTPGSASSVAPLAVGKPLHEMKFDDGSVLQILDLGIGEIMEGSKGGSPRGSWFSGFSSGSSTRCMNGGGVEAAITTHTLNERVTGLHFSSSTANLLLETRLLSDIGTATESNRILWQNTIRNGGDDPVFPGWDAMLSASPGDGDLPEVVVQLSDGAGGWINGCGPFACAKDGEYRGMVAFTAWPRTLSELEFRAVRPGAKPQTWKVRNPRQAVKPEPWTASKLPQTHSAPDFELILVNASKNGDSRLLNPQFRFLSKIPGDRSGSTGKFGDPTMLECRCDELQGAFGTRSKNGYLQLPDKMTIPGFPYPPDERVLRFRFVVKPGDSYPYPRTDAMLVARVKIAADGKSLEGRPALLAGHGILSVDFTDIQPGDKGGFQYTVRGRWNNPSEEAAGMAKLRTNKVPVCFADESSASVGESHPCNSGSSSTGGVTKYDYSVRWTGPLHPGDEFAVGMTTPLAEREVFFTFEPQ